nr:hypothetical protein [Tanacetum cinerariifolium]
FTDILLLEAILNSEPSPLPPNQEQNLPSFKEELKAYEAQTVKSSVDEPPEVELKDLPHHLEYAFLEGDNKLPVIIAKELGSEEKAALVKVLKSHKRAIAWKLSDIQGINLEFCTHKILMEEDYKPSVQHQRRKVSDCIKQCTELFERRTPEDLESALRLINEALQISTCSEKLLQMKADTIFMFRRYEQVIQVCEQTLTSDDADTATSSWKPHLISKSYFYLGRLEDALEVIKKQKSTDQITERVGNTSQESAIPLADTIRELLSHKTAGNEAYISGKHAEAVEHYTAALSCNVVSRPFASVCFCNRAAAYRGLGQITDAIADCSVAIALDPNYHKAISRRASFYEMIRDYGQAAKDLQRLVSLLTTQVEEKGLPSGASDKLCQINELKQTQQQLSNVEEESRKGLPLNMYLILGVESTASAPDIKKAYRKAALRHHPDKAAQSLSRSDGDDGLWKEIAENVHKDADRLFKMIGEAYAVLSNASKRSQYDQDEEMRNDTKRFARSNSSRTATDVQNSVFERSRSQRQW